MLNAKKIAEYVESGNLLALNRMKLEDEENIFEIEINALLKSSAAKNNKKIVDFLLKNLTNNINIALEGAALTGQAKMVKKLIKRGAKREFAAMGASAGEQYQLLNQLLKHSIDLQVVIWGANEKDFFSNEDNAIQFLAHIDDDKIRQKIAEIADSMQVGSYDVKECLILAGKIHQKMIAEKLTFKQAHASMHPKVKELYDELKHIPMNALSLVGSFLTPIEVTDLQPVFKQQFEQEKKEMTATIHHAYRKNCRSLLFYFDNSLDKIKQKLDKTQSRDELTELSGMLLQKIVTEKQKFQL